MMSEILTDEQVENWRRVIVGMLGPYALIMTREQIMTIRDRLQFMADLEPASKGETSEKIQGR
jgi:hypothetical protein